MEVPRWVWYIPRVTRNGVGTGMETVPSVVVFAAANSPARALILSEDAVRFQDQREVVQVSIQSFPTHRVHHFLGTVETVITVNF